MDIILDQCYTDYENKYSITKYTIHSHWYGQLRFCFCHLDQPFTKSNYSVNSNCHVLYFMCYTVCRLYMCIMPFYNKYSLCYVMLCFQSLRVEETVVPGGNHGNLSDLVTTLSLHMSYARVLNQAVRGEPKPSAPVRTLGNLYCTNYRATVYKE